MWELTALLGESGAALAMAHASQHSVVLSRPKEDYQQDAVGIFFLLSTLARHRRKQWRSRKNSSAHCRPKEPFLCVQFVVASFAWYASTAPVTDRSRGNLYSISSSTYSIHRSVFCFSSVFSPLCTMDAVRFVPGPFWLFSDQATFWPIHVCKISMHIVWLHSQQENAPPNLDHRRFAHRARLVVAKRRNNAEEMDEGAVTLVVDLATNGRASQKHQHHGHLPGSK